MNAQFGSDICIGFNFVIMFLVEYISHVFSNQCAVIFNS